MSNGDYLSLTVWPGKSDPTAEVLTVQVRHQSGQGWETLARLAAYRTADGRYSQLPERSPMSADMVKSEPIDLAQPSGNTKIDLR